MARYTVLQPGFINSVLHKPDHPRHGVVTTDSPLDPVPSWLELIKDAPAPKKRKSAAKTSAAKKRAADDKAIEEASFMTTNGVETL